MSLEWFKNLQEQRAALDKQIQEQGETKLKEMFDIFFKENPAVEKITWQQFTPFWNDGESCVFSVYEPVFLRALPIEEGEEPTEDEEDEYEEEYDTDDDEDGIVIGSSAGKHEEDCLQEYLNGREDPHGMAEYYKEKIEAYRVDKTLIDNVEEFKKFFKGNNEVFELVFDDHVRVTATRKGFKVDEYEHD